MKISTLFYNIEKNIEKIKKCRIKYVLYINETYVMWIIQFDDCKFKPIRVFKNSEIYIEDENLFWILQFEKQS